MAEEKDTIGRDEPLNEEAPTPQTAGDAADAAPAADAPARAGKFDRLTQDEGGVRKLTGMYKNWFLDYASYVILERAVPHVEDGLKPVQRRILHAMKVVDDGRYNKVANIVGQTMQYHPHGDASIKDALVQLGQKDLLIDCQGNWGNILTGDEAAAGRYIEARLSKFASEVVFNKKTTEWMLSYDGRKEEPVTLPIKFPLLLAQGSDGIAVGLASKILPHNFVELINACIAHLEGREFQLYPDFPTGGMADVSRYNDGLRGGAVKVRAKISKIDKRTLAITEIPYTTTTESAAGIHLRYIAQKGKHHADGQFRDRIIGIAGSVADRDSHFLRRRQIHMIHPGKGDIDKFQIRTAFNYTPFQRHIGDYQDIRVFTSLDLCIRIVIPLICLKSMPRFFQRFCIVRQQISADSQRFQHYNFHSSILLFVGFYNSFRDLYENYNME